MTNSFLISPMATESVQKASDHGHFLGMKNSAYHCPYDLADNKVNAIYKDYKIKKI